VRGGTSPINRLFAPLIRPFGAPSPTPRWEKETIRGDNTHVERYSVMTSDSSTNGGEGASPLPEDLKRYHDIMVEQGLLELEVREKGFYLRLARRSAVPAAPVVVDIAPAAPAPAAATAAPVREGTAVLSPLAGTFYRSPSPQSPPFVKEGGTVSVGDVLCVVEAMKVMNEIRAEKAGVVLKVLVDNAQAVSAGQELFLLNPLS
jgi:acetyl-CoA carboxylase biotin carboxyl carrier protein